jgi:hypothetical protein
MRANNSLGDISPEPEGRIDRRASMTLHVSRVESEATPPEFNNKFLTTRLLNEWKIYRRIEMQLFEQPQF